MYVRFLSFILAIVVLSCSSKKENSNNPAAGSENQTSDTTNADLPKDGKNTFDGFDAYVGKKPAEVQLFEKANLNARIEKLLGGEFADFKADWNTESTIMKDGEILYFVGCKSSACAENKYFVMLDLIINNLNIINIRNGRPRSFEEGPVIGMPDKLAGDFEKIRQAQGL
jgi:hypothetical protein